MSHALTLGAVPPDSSFMNAISPAMEAPSNKFYARDTGMIAAALQSLQLPFDITQYPQCTSSGGPSNVGLNTGIGLAATFAPLTGPAAPFIAIGAGIVGMISGIFSAHAKAVKVEQQDTCAAAP